MQQHMKRIQQLGTSNNVKVIGLLLAVLIIVVYSYKLVIADNQHSSTLDVSDDTSTQSMLENTDLEKSFVDSQNNTALDKDSVDQVSISGDSVIIDVDSSANIKQNNSTSNISVEISSKAESSSNNSTDNDNNPAPNLMINGEEIEIPENGRLRETIKDGDTTTRLRTNIDNDGSSSISIRTNSN